MPAQSQFASRLSSPASNLRSRSRRLKTPVWILGLIAVAALAMMVSKVMAASNTPGASVLTPGIQLAIGTFNLEGTAQAVDSASAAKLLPLWELLAQLSSGGTAAPEEITATIEEIKLNMTAEQIAAIDAMPASSASAFNLGAPANTSSKAVSTQAASFPGVDQMIMGGDPGAMGGAPADGGGPMPSGNTSTTSSKTSSASSVPTAIQQVIELLKSKVQS